MEYNPRGIRDVEGGRAPTVLRNIEELVRGSELRGVHARPFVAHHESTAPPKPHVLDTSCSPGNLDAVELRLPFGEEAFQRRKVGQTVEGHSLLQVWDERSVHLKVELGLAHWVTGSG